MQQHGARRYPNNALWVAFKFGRVANANVQGDIKCLVLVTSSSGALVWSNRYEIVCARFLYAVRAPNQGSSIARVVLNNCYGQLCEV